MELKQTFIIRKRMLDLDKVLPTTMYNRNYGGFDYVRIHSELLKAVLNRTN